MDKRGDAVDGRSEPGGQQGKKKEGGHQDILLERDIPLFGLFVVRWKVSGEDRTRCDCLFDGGFTANAIFMDWWRHGLWVCLDSRRNAATWVAERLNSGTMGGELDMVLGGQFEFIPESGDLNADQEVKDEHDGDDDPIREEMSVGLSSTCTRYRNDVPNRGIIKHNANEHPARRNGAPYLQNQLGQ